MNGLTEERPREWTQPRRCPRRTTPTKWRRMHILCRTTNKKKSKKNVTHTHWLLPLREDFETVSWVGLTHLQLRSTRRLRWSFAGNARLKHEYHSTTTKIQLLEKKKPYLTPALSHNDNHHHTMANCHHKTIERSLSPATTTTTTTTTPTASHFPKFQHKTASPKTTHKSLVPCRAWCHTETSSAPHLWRKAGLGRLPRRPRQCTWTTAHKALLNKWWW